MAGGGDASDGRERLGDGTVAAETVAGGATEALGFGVRAGRSAGGSVGPDGAAALRAISGAGATSGETLAIGSVLSSVGVEAADGAGVAEGAGAAGAAGAEADAGRTEGAGLVDAGASARGDTASFVRSSSPASPRCATRKNTSSNA